MYQLLVNGKLMAEGFTKEEFNQTIEYLPNYMKVEIVDTWPKDLNPKHLVGYLLEKIANDEGPKVAFKTLLIYGFTVEQAKGIFNAKQEYIKQALIDYLFTDLTVEQIQEISNSKEEYIQKALKLINK